MASDASAQPDQEEWDLPPAGPLLTRDRLLAHAHAHGAEVSARDLIFWESEGVLPRPPKRWHQGATRAVYPPWAAYYVVALRLLQREGRSLAEIGEELRGPLHRTLARVACPHANADAAGVPPLAVALLDAMRSFGAATGTRPVRADVRFFDAAGREVSSTRHDFEDVGDEDPPGWRHTLTRLAPGS
ncbi:MAG: hypothetical protein M3Y83_08055 [Actinomycetota bacterium]|nr:hypothetical protein [Actinomycetota bacterium]